MKKITFSMNPKMRGQQVADLQDALQLCLDRSALLASNDVLRRDLSEKLKPERAAQTYGELTRKLVRLNDKSRMKRELHVRFCERLEGKLLWPTRPGSHCFLQ